MRLGVTGPGRTGQLGRWVGSWIAWSADDAWLATGHIDGSIEIRHADDLGVETTLTDLAGSDGFVTEVDEDSLPPGLSEDIIRRISAKKDEPEFMLQWRLQAYRHWLTMKTPKWAHVHYPPIDYQNIVYYSAPRKKEGPKSLDEVDPKLLETYEKLGIPLQEQEMLAGVSVYAVFDSVSVATTFRTALAEKGIIFCSFSEAVREHPELVRKYLGSVVPHTDRNSLLASGILRSFDAHRATAW